MVRITSLLILATGSLMACAVASDSNTGGLDSGTTGADEASESSEGDGSTTEATGVCPAPAAPDLAFDANYIPMPDGTSTIASMCDVTASTSDASTRTLELACDAAELPSPLVLTFENLPPTWPGALDQGASLEAVVSAAEELDKGRWVALRAGEALVLAAGSGTTVYADFRMAPPQDMWAPLVMTPVASDCETQVANCNTMVQRAGLRFEGLEEPPLELFDHEVRETQQFTIATGEVKLGVGLDTCDGGSSSSFDFVVLRKE